MKKYLVITIDVEPDCSSNWTYSNPLTFAGVSKGIANRLQPLFNKYNIVPTYLINNVVLEDDESVDIFRSLEGQFELGTHLHPEFIEPVKTEFNYAGKKGVRNCCFYPPKVENDKIESITRLFEKQFGYSPKSFRAGRFSAGDNTIHKLAELNYKVDTSVTPFIRWDDRTRERPVDFRFAPDQPYWTEEKIITPGPIGKGLLEVPVSIAAKKLSPSGWLRHLMNKKRIPFRASEFKWLRPVYSDINDFQMILESIGSRHPHQRTLTYNMMFHNVEVMPGLSPYSLTEQDCERYLLLLEHFFQYCQKKEIDSVSLSALYDVCQ